MAAATCPYCGKLFSFSENDLGRALQCPHCRMNCVVAPTAGSPAPTGAPSNQQPAAPQDTTAGHPLPTGADGGAPGSTPATAGAASLGAAAQGPAPAGSTAYPGPAAPGMWGATYPVNQMYPVGNGTATAALVLGIVSLAMCGVPGIVCGILAIVFSRKARALIQSGQMNPSAEGSVKAGHVCGTIGLCLGILMLLFMVAYFIFIFAIIGTVSGRFSTGTSPTSFPAYPLFPTTAPGGSVLEIVWTLCRLAGMAIGT